MNLVNIAMVLAAVAFVWSAVLLTFCHFGWMDPNLSILRQPQASGATVLVAGLICYSACLPFVLYDEADTFSAAP